MYQRFEIPTAPAPPLHPVPNKFLPVVRRPGLAWMLLREAFHYRFQRDVLLSRPCIYGVFSGPVGGFLPRTQLCVGCMRCVQEYPDVCQVFVDERWKALGDSYFTPDSISTLNYEATTGKIMVKGVGYKGPFAGEGFDGLWTDMSEIVRPTRDGIYGREYISTAVELGRKPTHVDPRAETVAAEEPVLELQVPFLFDLLPDACRGNGAEAAAIAAAARVRSLCLLPWRGLACAPIRRAEEAVVVPVVAACEAVEAARFLAGKAFPAIEWTDAAPADLPRLRSALPGSVPLLRVPLGSGTSAEVRALAAAGAGAFHVTADYHGRTADGSFVKDALLKLHDSLVEAGLREQVTLVASGGIVRAEHVPKAILCGADLVALDTAVWVAQGAALRGEFTRAGRRALDFPPLPPAWGAQRIVNFCAAWRDQLLEILSAMGLREVRRLRGELGRAMSYEDLEKEAFGDLERSA